jgi:gamma-glutamyltranspeptidase/glutathione hydrolase
MCGYTRWALQRIWIGLKLPQCPPNGQGITALLALGILEAAQEKGIIKPLVDMEHNSPEYLHALIEALR